MDDHATLEENLVKDPNRSFCTASCLLIVLVMLEIFCAGLNILKQNSSAGLLFPEQCLIHFFLNVSRTERYSGE